MNKRPPGKGRATANEREYSRRGAQEEHDRFIRARKAERVTGQRNLLRHSTGELPVLHEVHRHAVRIEARELSLELPPCVGPVGLDAQHDGFPRRAPVANDRRQNGFLLVRLFASASCEGDQDKDDHDTAMMDSTQHVSPWKSWPAVRRMTTLAGAGEHAVTGFILCPPRRGDRQKVTSLLAG